MIYAELAGGLGNQMFIYAFARALGLRCGEGVTLLDRQDWRDGAPAHTVCALGALDLAPEVRILAEPGFAKRHLPRQNAAKALMIKYEQRNGMNDAFGVLATWPGTLGIAAAVKGTGRIDIIDKFADTIRRELRAKQSPAGSWAAAIDAAAWPVALHLRRGDYARPEKAILQVCTPAYYARAAAAVKAARPDAEVFVFSDDVDWARANLDTAGLPAQFVPRGDAVADLALMQRCRGFILSNSTYSWWAQYLAPAAAAVWAPDRWYAHTKRTALYQPHWQLVETK